MCLDLYIVPCVHFLPSLPKGFGDSDEEHGDKGAEIVVRASKDIAG